MIKKSGVWGHAIQTAHVKNTTERIMGNIRSKDAAHMFLMH